MTSVGELYNFCFGGMHLSQILVLACPWRAMLMLNLCQPNECKAAALNRDKIKIKKHGSSALNGGLQC